MAVFDPVVFDPGVFDTGAPAVQAVTSTATLQLPVNCALAGQQPYEMVSARDPLGTRPSEKHRSGVLRLKGPAPSFKTTSSSKGY